MKTSLEHLPEGKRAQLAAVAALFREKLPLGLLVLFGSHARGDWVDDPLTGTKSDLDLLAVVHEPTLAADGAFFRGLEARFRELAAPSPVVLLVHTVGFVNREIRMGQYFFADVANEGVALYDGRHFALARPKALNAQERLRLGEQNFAYWFRSASEFVRGCRYYAARGRLNEAAFLLHQAVERYHHASLLVFTGYKTHSHDIEALGKLAAEQHASLAGVFPRGTPDDDRLFLLLKKAYIEARYSQSYRITLGELSALQGHVLELARRVREACLEKLASFGGEGALSPTLPSPPTLDEPLLADLPPPPTDPADFTPWAASIAELAEARVREGELRGKLEGLREGEAKGEARGRAEGLREGEAKGKAEGLLEGEAKGKAEGKAEGLREGKAEGLRTAVLDLCEAFGIEVTGEQRAQLEAMALGELEALRRALKQTRRWPQGAQFAGQAP